MPSWVGPGLKALGPQVIGSTAIDRSRRSLPVNTWIQSSPSPAHSSAHRSPRSSRARQRPSSPRVSPASAVSKRRYPSDLGGAQVLVPALDQDQVQRQQPVVDGQVALGGNG